MTRHFAILAGPPIAKPALVHRRTFQAKLSLAVIAFAAIAFLVARCLAAVALRFVAVLAGDLWGAILAVQFEIPASPPRGRHPGIFLTPIALH